MKDTSLGPVCAFCKKDQTVEEECGQMCHSSNGSIHVHYLCLLYSSALCTDSQTLQETICNFPVEEVRKEILRGKKLRCSGCKRVGATVGCQIRRCPRTYHYSCAVEKKVFLIADEDEGIYQICCGSHDFKSQRRKTATERKRHRSKIETSLNNSVNSDETHCSFNEEPLPMDASILSVRNFWDNLVKADLVKTVFQPLCDLIRHGEASNQGMFMFNTFGIC
uniref:PHD-type domain-containing protein n=1 Tax=Eptatretus burgeri TaxID=7764 RepID=A0A8C4QQH7_EPTBU